MDMRKLFAADPDRFSKFRFVPTNDSNLLRAISPPCHHATAKARPVDSTVHRIAHATVNALQHDQSTRCVCCSGAH